MADVEGCIACDLMAGRVDRPGGLVHQTPGFAVEHCVGPLGVGTLLVKPRRHCLSVGALTPEEAQQLGPVLRGASACVQELMGADQVYVCLWSHADWTPGHIHFVVQPAWDRDRDKRPGPGPLTQVSMFANGELPERAAVEAFCDRAREWKGWDS